MEGNVHEIGIITNEYYAWNQIFFMQEKGWEEEEKMVWIGPWAESD